MSGETGIRQRSFATAQDDGKNPNGSIIEPFTEERLSGGCLSTKKRLCVGDVLLSRHLAV